MEYKASSPITVAEVLRLLYPDSSRRTLQTWLKKGRFRIDGEKVQREESARKPRPNAPLSGVVPGPQNQGTKNHL